MLKKINRDFFAILFLTILGLTYFYFIRGYRLDNLQYFIDPSGDIYSLIYMPVKIMTENTWIYSTNMLGAPFVGNFYDFQVLWIDTLHFIFIKLLTLFFSDISYVIGLYYVISGFGIIYISYIVLRMLKVSIIFSIWGSIVYFTIPYYFIRIGHYELVLYQFIPLSLLLCYWCYFDDKFFIINRNQWKYRKNIYGLIICICLALTGLAYYTSYVCILLFITGILKSKLKDIKKIRSSLTAIIILLLIFLINVSPALVYQYENGRNTQVASRNIGDTERFGLKLTQLILPIYPKTDYMKSKVEQYNNEAPLVTENSTASIGLIGTLGEFLLLIYLFKESYFDKKILLLSRLNLGLFLWGTIGGLSTLFGLFINPIFRSNNRTSIFIAFIAITTICIFFDRIIQQKNSLIKKRVYYIVFSLFMVVGIFLQLPEKINGEYYNDIKNKIEIQKSFFSEIEKTLPSGSMVYQLPYVPFPEYPAVNKMEPYEHLTAYIYSNNLKWSYGAMKGRYEDDWQNEINILPLEQKLKILSIVGFKGIYIDRRAYNEKDLIDLEESLKYFLDVQPIVSTDNTRIFYSMEKYNEKYLREYNESELNILKQNILNMKVGHSDLDFNKSEILVEGFYDKEDHFRWMRNEAKIIPEKISLEKISFIAYTNKEDFSNLKIKIGNNFIKTYKVNNKGTLIAFEIPYNDIGQIIFLETDANKVEDNGEIRDLYIRIEKEDVVYSNLSDIIKNLK